MKLDLRGRRALVTGASRGIGLAIARSLAAEGARVTLVARDAKALSAGVRQLAGRGHRALALDLAAARGPGRLVAALDPREAPEILVHSVGGTLEERDPLCGPRAWRRILRLNLEVAVELNAALVPAMKAAGWGRIVHISSVSGGENLGPVPYCTAKAALNAYTRSLGRVLAPDGIVVAAVCPGAVLAPGNYWDRSSRERPEHVAQYVRERMPMARFGRPEEIADVVTFLCSGRAGQCAGGVFQVDGGMRRAF